MHRLLGLSLRTCLRCMFVVTLAQWRIVILARMICISVRRAHWINASGQAIEKRSGVDMLKTYKLSATIYAFVFSLLKLMGENVHAVGK